jgi:hypothetical protein
MYLSYSGFKLFTSCPFAYWHDYVNHTKIPGVDDRLGSIFGSAVGLVFEWFYSERLWKVDRDKGEEVEPAVLAKAALAVDSVLRRETLPNHGKPGGVMLWKGTGTGQNPEGMYANRDELLADVRDAVARGLRIIKFYRLLGKKMEAEVVLDSNIKGHKIVGRADFIIERTKPHLDLVLIDGKGSRHRGKYVDPRQLKWYAMLYREHFNKLPDRLGFLFWRYEPPETLDWIDFDEDSVTELQNLVLATVRQIEGFEARRTTSVGDARRVWLPKADEKACRFCAYATADMCPKGCEVVREIAAKKLGRKSGVSR